MRKRSWIIWAAAFLGWMLMGLSFSVNDYVFRDLLKSYYVDLPSLPSMLFWDLVYWPIWAVIAPLIFLIVRRFPLGRNSWHPNLLINLVAGLSLTVLQRIIYLLIAWPLQMAMGEEIPFLPLLIYNLPTGLMSYVLILLIGHLINYYNRYQEEELRVSRLKAELTQAQLQALKMQLQPHFLFNTLNSISALLRKDVGAADEMLARLGDFLRLTLENSSAQTVTLEEELEFLRRYLEIVQVRLEDQIQIRYDVEEQTLAAQVPNLILQPSIENTIKHGVGGSFGQVQIVVSARRVNGNLCLQIKDDGESWQSNSEGYKKGFGIKNTCDRLKSAYGSDCRFELMRTPDGWTMAILEMPFVTRASGI